MGLDKLRSKIRREVPDDRPAPTAFEIGLGWSDQGLDEDERPDEKTARNAGAAYMAQAYRERIEARYEADPALKARVEAALKANERAHKGSKYREGDF